MKYAVLFFCGFLIYKLYRAATRVVVLTEEGELLVKNELKEIAQKLSGHELQTIKIDPHIEPVSNVWQSKFGGDPYWPKAKEYPVTKKGRPLLFLAQINLSELPKLANLRLPGILQFFIGSDDIHGLEYPNKKKTTQDIIADPNGYRVIYHPDVDMKMSNLQHEFPTRKTYSPVRGEYSLEFKLEYEKPSPTDFRLELIVGDLYDNYSELTAERLFDEYDSAGSKIGGYAYFTQEDPRFYEEAMKDWVLLFQMDTSSKKDVNIMWGDAGVANFFILPEDLKNLDFSRVWYHWDCT